MVENRDVIEYPLAMLWRHRTGIHKKINGIRDDYRNNSYNFKAKLMRLSDDMNNCLKQQFAVGYCFVTMTGEKIEKIVSLLMRYVN